MKKCIFMMLMFSAFSAQADNIFDRYDRMFGSVAMPAMTISAPTAFAGALYDCKNGGNEEDGMACAFGSVTFGVISTSSISALLLLKEEIAQVEQDAYNALAGEGISDALKAVVNQVRSETPELSEGSDEQIISLLLEVNQIQ